MAGILVIDDATGISMFIVRSWQFLSGVDVPANIVGDCNNGSSSLGYGLMLVLMFIISILNIIPGLAAIVGLPAGIVVTFAGAVRSLVTKNHDWLQLGLKILLFGLGGVIVAGLVMRILHLLSGAIGCTT